MLRRPPGDSVDAFHAWCTVPIERCFAVTTKTPSCYSLRSAATRWSGLSGWSRTGTRLVRNPAGRGFGNARFDDGLVIEVG